ncbi:MAG: flagellar hook-associated protein FlgL, partial [candidate division Zixibacteria bacterium]|nr:flagellar hook-associated protein FlgL [candidate division Zixibacteria bacterium]
MYRVTQSMLSNQVMFNLTRTPSRFFELQNMMSTNRRINKPSDDPIGTIRDLSYRERLADITQFKANISMGRTWMLSIDSALGDANNAAAAAYEIAVEMANDTYDATARMAAANQAQSLGDQIIEAANIQVQGRYLFSGYKTATRPFEVGAGGAVYQGDSGTIELSVDSNSRVQVNTIGADVFTKPFRILGEETDLQPGVTTTTLLSNLKNGQGIDLTTGIIKITDVNLNTTVSVDLNAAPLVTTVGDVINRINADLATGGITNVTASLGLEGNNIRLVATDNPAITDATPVANLNSGNGIDMEPGTFVIRNAAGTINQTIDISAATTIGELRTAIETQLGQPTVTVSINATNTGLEISDTGGLGLYVEDPLPSETTAA